MHVLGTFSEWMTLQLTMNEWLHARPNKDQVPRGMLVEWMNGTSMRVVPMQLYLIIWYYSNSKARRPHLFQRKNTIGTDETR